MKVKALKNRVLVSNIKRGERKVGGIVIPDDDGKNEGVRPRWAKVYDTGEGINDINIGEWILIEHGRWTREMKIKDDNGDDLSIWQVDYPDSVLAVMNEEPDDHIFSSE